MGYCDIHCHIIPGVDDGSKDLAESIGMIEIAAKSGITDIILTPHYKPGRLEHSKERFFKELETLKKHVKDNGFDVNLYLGTELMFSEDCIELLENDKILSMNDSKHILVEFRPMDSAKYIKDCLYKITCCGYTPVLAHVERYVSMIEAYDDIEEIINRGALIQVNASSVIGKIGGKVKKFIKMLMKYDMLHFIGTDAHDIKERTPDMKKCADYIEKKFGKEYRDELLINNPVKYFNITR
ncbi:MAG: hypothetical protein J6L69_05730 [Lachnospiraceae bacterium]|nr:hypothetical protein [Lachnospiraceae bacterium]